MKKIIIFILLPLYLIATLTSCGDIFEKDPYKRSKEIHRFFRCKVNGREWHNRGFGGDDSQMEYYDAPDSVERSGRFVIDMENRPDKDHFESIFIYIKRDLMEGDNMIDNYKDNPYNGTSYPVRIFGAYSPIYRQFYLDTTFYSNLFITDIDSTNKIIKGKLEFRAISWDKIDTVYVTDGEFNWKPYWYRWK